MSAIMYPIPFFSPLILNDCFPPVMVVGNVVERFEVFSILIVVGAVTVFPRLSLTVISPVMVVSGCIWS
jgi:hypothetical protein